jgi:Tfp pilus assembly PilM family ATPase
MSKCKITGKVLAIQLGRDETKIALMSSASEIIYSQSIPTPPGAVEDGAIRNQEAVHKMLKTALSTPEFKGHRRVVFSLCTSQVISDTVATPQVSEQKLDKLIQANADMYFPVDMKEYKLVWQVVGPRVKENGLKELAVQLWAVPTAMVSRYYAVANACGLSVEAIDYCGNSVASAVGASFSMPVKKAAKKKLNLNAEISFGKKKEQVEPETSVAVEDKDIPETQAYISLDSDLLGMTFVQDDRVVLQRFIQCGSDASYQLSELAMLLDYYSALDVGRGSPVTAHVFGSLASNRELVADLADMLGIPLQVMEPVSSAKYLLCTGAARTTEDYGIPSLNRARAAQKQVSSQLWQYVLILAGGAVLALSIMLLLSSRLIWSSEINGLKSSQQALAIQAQKYNGFKDNYDAYSSLYNRYSGDWDTVFANLRTNNDKLVMVLEELESMLPETSSVLNLAISPDGLNVTFACQDKEEAAYLIMALRKLKYSELTYISSLAGGGKGPATSYGPNREPEKAPTKGGYMLTYSAKPSIGNLIADEVSKEELMALAVTLTPEQYDRVAARVRRVREAIGA